MSASSMFGEIFDSGTSVRFTAPCRVVMTSPLRSYRYVVWIGGSVSGSCSRAYATNNPTAVHAINTTGTSTRNTHHRRRRNDRFFAPVLPERCRDVLAGALEDAPCAAVDLGPCLGT